MKLVFFLITFALFELYLTTLNLPAHVVRIVILTVLIVCGAKIRREKKHPAYIGTGMMILGCLLGIPSFTVFTGFINTLRSAGKLAELIFRLI